MEGKEDKAEETAGGDDAVEAERRGCLPSAVYRCIRACDLDIGRDLWDSIIVTGVRVRGNGYTCTGADEKKVRVYGYW